MKQRTRTKQNSVTLQHEMSKELAWAVVPLEASVFASTRAGTSPRCHQLIRVTNMVWDEWRRIVCTPTLALFLHAGVTGLASPLSSRTARQSWGLQPGMDGWSIKWWEDKGHIIIRMFPSYEMQTVGERGGGFIIPRDCIRNSLQCLWKLQNHWIILLRTDRLVGWLLFMLLTCWAVYP